MYFQRTCNDNSVSKKLVCCVQVREAAITTLVDVYRHVGERVRADLGKRGLPAARWVIALCWAWFVDAHSDASVRCLFPSHTAQQAWWLCPSQGHWISLKNQKPEQEEGADSIQRSIGVVTRPEESVRSCLLTEESIERLRLFRLWRWPLLLLTAQDESGVCECRLASCVAWCVVHIKAGLFTLQTHHQSLWELSSGYICLWSHTADRWSVSRLNQNVGGGGIFLARSHIRSVELASDSERHIYRDPEWSCRTENSRLSYFFFVIL